MAKRSKSSQRWLERQKRDPYVKQAASERLGSRAHFKLAQLDRRFSLLRPQMSVLELGAAPGGWTRYLAGRLNRGRIIAVDCQPMQIPPGVVFLCLDIHSGDVDRELVRMLGEARLDLVLSDMSPNITGVRAADQAAAMDLVDHASEISMRWLKPGGALVVKMFQGDGIDEWLQSVRRRFAKAVLAKPPASRSGSREVYGVAIGFTQDSPDDHLRGS